MLSNLPPGCTEAEIIDRFFGDWECIEEEEFEQEIIDRFFGDWECIEEFEQEINAAYYSHMDDLDHEMRDEGRSY